MADLTVGNFNGDRYCDVKDDNGVVYLTPPGPELHGRRLQSLGSPAVYLILDGKRYLIPDAGHLLQLVPELGGQACVV
jgi:hypothetical protein